jgi:lysophospholipase L1-like esterase
MTTVKARVIACLGSSSTAGKGQAFNWIGELSRRSRNKDFRFRNFGVGGDLAYNAMRRLPKVFACHPEKVVVWVGGNDVLALVSTKVRRFFRRWKHLPREPSPQWFHECIQTMTRRLKEGVPAVALCSLSPIGEAPESTNPFQQELNQRVAEYSAIIKRVSREEAVGYIPIYEELLTRIQASPIHAFTRFRFLPFYRDAFRVLVLRKSLDEVARMNDWRFHTDGVHLNSAGGMIVADLIQQFIQMPSNQSLQPIAGHSDE